MQQKTNKQKYPTNKQTKKPKQQKKKQKQKQGAKGRKNEVKEISFEQKQQLFYSQVVKTNVWKRGSEITIPGEQLSLSRWVRLEDLKRFLLTSVILWPSGKPCPERFLNQTDSFVLLLTGAASGDKKSNHTGGGRFWERTFLRGLSLCSLPLSEPSQFIIGVGKMSSKKDMKP